MGEALISRAGGGEIESPIPITPGYHTVRVTLKDWNNTPVQNYAIACNDGSAMYEYTTNEKGQCLFVCNSGSANIHIRNVINGVTIADIGDSWANIDAPVGLTTDVKLNLIKGPNYVDYTSSKTFNTLIVSEADLDIIGGGGGGGAGDYENRDSFGGGGGAGGNWNRYNNIPINRTPLSFVAGSGGSGGYWRSGSTHSSANVDGKAGGTSYIANTSYSAYGGGGGNSSSYSTGSGAANVGTGKGGNGNRTWNVPSELVAAMNSPLDFAGGGGRGGCKTRNMPSMIGGYPYGGSGAWSNNSEGEVSGGSGSRGGGGGGGLGDDSRGGSGGTGMMRLYLHY